MAWLSLVIAGIFEIIGVFIMKKYVNTNEIKFIILLILCFACSFTFLSFSMQSIPMSVTYAIWTGIGAGGGVVVGVIFFKESKKISKLFFIALILLSSVALKLLA